MPSALSSVITVSLIRMRFCFGWAEKMENRMGRQSPQGRLRSPSRCRSLTEPCGVCTPTSCVSATSENTGSADAAASKDTAPPAVEDAPAFSQWSDHPNQQKESAPAGSDYRAPTVGETVVRMLHHMSGIFEVNSKIDQIHRGLQIDRKRRQELQRKRLAMGHKPDDHEEQTFR